MARVEEELLRELSSLSERLAAEGRPEAVETLRKTIRALRDADTTTAARHNMLTTTEAAQLLGIRSVNTIKRWASDGRLEGYRLGSRVLVSRPSVERMLNDAALSRQRSYEGKLDEALAPLDGDDEDVGALTGGAHRGRTPWSAGAAARV